MSGIVIVLIAIAALGLGYLVYGRFLEKKWGIDPKERTPALKYRDDVDYVPSDKSVVFGHQFASIAGAGPINGPVQAAMFGWVPILIWLLCGAIFFGGVQDFAAMYTSVRNKGRSLGYIIEKYVGKIGKRLFLLFTWLFSVLVVAAFSDIVCKTFDGIGGTAAENAAGSHVSLISLLFMAFAVILGMILRRTKLPSFVKALIAIAFLVTAIVIGMTYGVSLSSKIWQIIVFVYVAVACISPVWILLQPRDYLNSFLLVAMIIAAVVGIFAANPTMKLDAFSGFTVNGQMLFPYMFVTVACGAISGFHALVSSGTASKQIRNEKDMLPISYGAMMLESLLAVIVLVAVGAKFGSSEIANAGTPATAFASAIASFLSVLHIPEDISFSLISLSVSAFALTSLDSVARVGRLSFQEFFTPSSGNKNNIQKVLSNKYFATGVTVLFGYILAKIGYQNIWPLFGAANQLLGVLSLIVCAAFLKHTKRKGIYVYIPMAVMLVISMLTLVFTVKNCTESLVAGSAASIAGVAIQLFFAVAIFVVGIIVSVNGIKAVVKKKAN